MPLPARDHVVADPIKELFSANARLADANKIIAQQVQAIATAVSALREIAKEQSAPTATVAADRFQTIAKAALAEIEGRAPANAVQVEG